MFNFRLGSNTPGLIGSNQGSQSTPKYHNSKTTVDGIKFDSKKEANRYRELCMLERAGQIENLQRQVKFELLPKSQDERAVCYIADFVYWEDSGEDTVKVVEDVKGVRTKDYIIKRKLVKYLHPNWVFREI